MGSNTQRLSKFQVTKAKCIFKCHQYPRELAQCYLEPVHGGINL